ncbi:MAG: amidohydrolase [Gemmatimonadota bacterium]
MRNSRFASLVASAVILTTGACDPSASPQEAADLVFLNGRVVTMEEEMSEAQALAVRGHSIQAVGTTAEIQALVGSDTEVVDLDGRLLIPGFIEGHGHFLGLGRSRMILDLVPATSWTAIVDQVAAAVATAEPGEWILGRGWHQERWSPAPTPAVDGVPLHHELSRISPDNPVHLTHASGHASFANAMAMELAGIHRNTPDPAGGTIVKGPDGEPTGLLRETAQRLVGAAQAEARQGMSDAERHEELRQQVRLAGEVALAHGVTSFHDAGASFAEIDFFREMAAADALPVRLYVMVRSESNPRMEELLPEYRTVGQGNDFLTVRSIKRQIDGALGAHGAWLLEPYEDLPSSTGLVLETPEDIAETARIALMHGFQLNTHAIGDRANREVLDIYQEAFQAHGNPEDPRWRIEHAQHLHPDDVERFAQLGVVASVQGIHGTSDGPWVLARLGEERARSGAYLWRSLLDAGVVVNNGTDTPVEPIDPIPSFHASATRVMITGEAFYPAQAMTRMEALKSYTWANAYAAFQEDRLGTLAPGKLADLVVLSRDILTVPDAEILDARADLTVVGGEVRYRRQP